MESNDPTLGGNGELIKPSEHTWSNDLEKNINIPLKYPQGQGELHLEL